MRGLLTTATHAAPAERCGLQPDTDAAPVAGPPSPQAAAPDVCGWMLADAAAKALGSFDVCRPARFRLEADTLAATCSHDEPYDLAWVPGQGWCCASAVQDPQRAVTELYLPIASAGAHQPITIGHLGQSLDGFIATPGGDSFFVTGPQNILHLHRLRALCDAVIVGAGTVDADNPQLTTRLVAGSNPARVILDPSCRLPSSHTVFSDGNAVTLRVCRTGNAAPATLGPAERRLEIAAPDGALDLSALLRQLHALGYFRVLIEGGGVTVSSFLQAGLLDRVHIAVAPVLIGEGRPAVRLAPRSRLRDCLRPRHRIYRTGNDILFDCDLRAVAEPASIPAMTAPISQRIL